MELDKYKSTWKNQPEETNKVSKVEIYKMARSKSSSIVKWILIIGVLELLFWTGLSLITPDKYLEVYENFSLMSFLRYYTILHYIVIALFLILFYKNYKSVAVYDNTKKLTNKILKVRKTVKYYVYYNLIGFVIVTVVINIVMFSHPDTLVDTMNPDHLAISTEKLLSITLIIQIAALLIMVLILWLFYKITYGTLLKKLNKNYKELDTLENLN